MVQKVTDPSLAKAVISICSKFLVGTAVDSCPANSDTQSVQNLIEATFFNSGSGDPSDDLQAFMDVEHPSTFPQGQFLVQGFMYWQGQFFGNVGLTGNPYVGETFVAQLSWDQPNHQFVLSWTDVASGRTNYGVMPYSGISDTTPAAAPQERFGVYTFAPNCVGTHMLSSYADSFVRNVWIGK